MFDEKIEKIKEYNEELDVKLSSRLSIEQLGNLLCVLSDKGLIDGSEPSEKVLAKIEEVYTELTAMLEGEEISRAERRLYNKAYNALLAEVKTAFDLEPAGSIQGRMLAVGIAIGTGIGTAMSVANPAMMTIGIGVGVAIGAVLGKKKEAEAKASGKLF